MGLRQMLFGTHLLDKSENHEDISPLSLILVNTHSMGDLSKI